MTGFTDLSVIYIIFSEIEKSTYFTTAYRSDQDVKDIMSLGEHVILPHTMIMLLHTMETLI